MLEIKEIKKSYRSQAGKLEVLKGIDLKIEPKNFISIVGRSGCGKSTLLHIMGLLDTPDSGEISFLGKEVKPFQKHQQAKIRNLEFGFVFQFFHLIPELTLLENVMLPGLIAKKKNLKEKAEKMLEQVGLTDRSKHFPSQLSGGEKQRAAIVRALINDPQVVFCDEPTGNLDEESADNIINLITTLRSETDQAFCLVTHDRQLAAKADRVYQLNHGVLNLM